jgi:hypothetical protein
MKDKIDLSYWSGDTVHEAGCCEGWSTDKKDINGICPDCEHPTEDGEAASGCSHSPVDCDTCGHAPCTDYC